MSRSDKYALATLLFLLALSAVMQVLLADDGDKGWLFFAARRWIGGDRLYVDVVEVNPPLIIWLYGLSVWLAHHVLGLKDFELAGLLGLLASALSVWLCTRLIRLHAEFIGQKRRQAEIAILFAMIFIFLPPQSFFFDREHIMLVMTFPYVLRFMPSLATQRIARASSVAVGLLAALGFCIKPHSILLFVAVQLMFRLRERSWGILRAIENRIVIAAGLLYILCIWHFTPDYAMVILPMALETYSSFNRSGSSLLNLPPAILCAGLTFADFRPRYTTPYRRDVYYFLGVTAAFLVHTVISNGWDYTYYPLMSMLLFLSGWVYWEYQWLKREQEGLGQPIRQFIFGMRGCVISLATQVIYMAFVIYASMGLFAIKARCEHNPACVLQDPYVRYLHDNNIRSFGTVTLDYPKWVGLSERTGARWATRFNHLWMIPGLLRDKGAFAAEHPWMTQYVGSALAEDLNGKKPAVVFVDTGRQFFAYPRYVDLLEFLKSVPEFNAAWSQYHYNFTINDCKSTERLYFKAACRYDVYSRRTQ